MMLSIKFSSQFPPSTITTPSIIECTQFINNTQANSDRINAPKCNRRRSSAEYMRSCLNKAGVSVTSESTTSIKCKRALKLDIEGRDDPATCTALSVSPKQPQKRTEYPTPHIQLLNRFPTTNICLDDSLARKIQPWLPKRISMLSKWSLVFSLDQHGASLNTLYRRCSQHSLNPCLLIISDEHNEVFGAYLSESIHIDTTFYGTGECFLWKQERSSTNDSKVVAYEWKSKNDYMMYAHQDFFAIGGGDGRCGLWLNSDLRHGYTQPCLTFANPVLARQSSFQCIGLEIWTFIV